MHDCHDCALAAAGVCLDWFDIGPLPADICVGWRPLPVPLDPEDLAVLDDVLIV